MSSSPQVHSVNVSGLRDVEFLGEIVTTGFYKQPVSGNVHAHRLGLEGDAQADLQSHGGPAKAIYLYPHEHYAIWEQLLATPELPAGSFGENITTLGLSESQLCIGDTLRIGSALLQVRQPRFPCFKMQMRFERSDMLALFVRRGLPGWYASVLQDGVLSAGDPIEVVSRAPEQITVSDIWHYSLNTPAGPAHLAVIQRMSLLPDFWKHRILQRSAMPPAPTRQDRSQNLKIS